MDNSAMPINATSADEENEAIAPYDLPGEEPTSFLSVLPHHPATIGAAVDKIGGNATIGAAVGQIGGNDEPSRIPAHWPAALSGPTYAR
jgi:hypothetical protein